MGVWRSAFGVPVLVLVLVLENGVLEQRSSASLCNS
jgi:hypothetical protein